MTPRHLLMGGALAIAAWLAFFGDKTPAGDIAEPVARSGKAASAPAGVSAKPDSADGKTGGDTVIIALQPRERLIGGARAETRPDALFGSQSWAPPPPPPPPAAPPPPPSAPPLPFTYLGKKVEDGKWEVFLARGEQTLVVREKSNIDGVYLVQSIAPPALSLIYLPLKQVQTISIGGLD